MRNNFVVISIKILVLLIEEEQEGYEEEEKWNSCIISLRRKIKKKGRSNHSNMETSPGFSLLILLVASVLNTFLFLVGGKLNRP